MRKHPNTRPQPREARIGTTVNELTTNPNLETETGEAFVDETVSLETFGFTPRDLESLKKSGGDAPKLRHAAYLLLELATEHPMYSAPDERFGRRIHGVFRRQFEQ